MLKGFAWRFMGVEWPGALSTGHLSCLEMSGPWWVLADEALNKITVNFD